MNDLMISNEIEFSEKEGIDTVNARGLHSFFEIGKDFSTWIKDRIEKYNFIEHQDYIIVSEKTENGRPLQEYYFSKIAAILIATGENNEKAGDLRKKLIESEKNLKTAINKLLEEKEKQLQLEIREKRRLAIDNNVLSNHKNEAQRIADQFQSKALLFERLENMLFEYNGLTIEQYFSEFIECLIFDNNPEAEMSLSDIEQKTPRLSSTLRTKILNDMVKKGILKKIKNGYGLTFNQ